MYRKETIHAFALTQFESTHFTRPSHQKCRQAFSEAAICRSVCRSVRHSVCPIPMGQNAAF